MQPIFHVDLAIVAFHPKRPAATVVLPFGAQAPGGTDQRGEPGDWPANAPERPGALLFVEGESLAH